MRNPRLVEPTGAVVAGVGVAADEVGAGRVHLVLQRADLGGVHEVLALAGAGERRRAVDDELRALQGEDARQLGVEPEVVTDEHADRSPSGVPDGQRVARRERDAFGDPRRAAEMDLAVGALDAVGPDDRDGVVQPARLDTISFGHAEHDVHVVLLGQLGDSLGRRAGHRLGQPDVLVARTADRAAAFARRRADERLFGEGQQVDPLRGGLDDAGLDLVERRRLVAIDGCEIHHTDVERVVLPRHWSPRPCRAISAIKPQSFHLAAVVEQSLKVAIVRADRVTR